MVEVSNDALAQAVTTGRFGALSQLGIAVGDVRHWDRTLVREPRLLVPVDVQVLVVREGDEAMVRLPFRVGDDPLPPPDDPGERRPPGAHIMWTVPRAFGRGRVVDDPTAPSDPTRRLLELPVLPDRWVVLRLAVPVGSRNPLVQGWVLEADGATVTPLADWPTNHSRTVTVGPAVPADQLTVQVGGPAWASCYDAALGRLALHDPLADLDQAAPNGIVGDALSYVVAGWWSDTRHDPLNGVGSLIGYHRRLAELGWDDPDHPRPEGELEQNRFSKARAASAFGLTRAGRFQTAARDALSYRGSTSGFVAEAVDVADVRAAPTRSTLLHGRIHGVPWRSTDRPDDRPHPSRVKLALGPTSPSVAAVLASGAVSNGGGATPQRDAERILTAFSSGLLARIEQPDAWADIEQYEHAQGFTSFPGGTEAVDRFVDKPAPGRDPGSGFRPQRRPSFHLEPLVLAPNLLWSPTRMAPVRLSTPLSAAGPTGAARAAGAGLRMAVETTAAAASKAHRAATQMETSREVPRPAPAFAAPVAPVLAVVG
ncbi:MAG: hypothetical protein M3314_10670, partial [Actinomycetota bacterium]|nr:hypothetical protein [Actinomycetota bacterium]